MKYVVSTKANRYEFELKEGENGSIVSGNGEASSLNLRDLGHGRFTVTVNNRVHILNIIRQNDHYEVRIAGDHFQIRVEDEKEMRISEMIRHSRSGPTEQIVRAPIPGLVVKVLVEAGQQVSQGENLLILEAMKMENVIKSPHACIITAIKIREKETVQQNQELFRLSVIE